MAEITSALVKELRERTGAGMMDCKSALVEAGGEMEAARQILRKKGLAAAAKKAGRTAARMAGRTAADGAVGSFIAEGGKAGVIVEVNCETDFVAKTPDFQALVGDIAEHVAKNAPADVAALAEQSFAKEPGRTVGQAVTDKIALIKENIVVRRFARFELTGEGIVAAYVHSHAAKVGVLVELAKGSADLAQLQALAKDVAMHVAAASPAAAVYVARDEVPADVLEKEKEIYRAQAAASGKPANVVEKIAEGKVKEYYATFCLLEQPYIREPKQTVGQHLAGGAQVRRFVRYRLGEESGSRTE
jgi:elongation factor Ts